MLMLARPYCRSRILALTFCCLGLILLLKLTTDHHVFKTDHEELLQHVSNSTLGVGLYLCQQKLCFANQNVVPKDLCAWIGVANRSSRLNVTSRSVYWAGHRVCRWCDCCKRQSIAARRFGNEVEQRELECMAYSYECSRQVSLRHKYPYDRSDRPH